MGLELVSVRTRKVPNFARFANFASIINIPFDGVSENAIGLFN